MCQGLTAKDITIPSMKIITSEGTGSPSKSARGANEAKAPEQVVCPLYSGRVPQRLIASYIIASHVLVVARAVASPNMQIYLPFSLKRCQSSCQSKYADLPAFSIKALPEQLPVPAPSRCLCPRPSLVIASAH